MRIRWKVLKNIRPYTAMVKGPILGLLIASLLLIPVTLISPRFFQLLIDEVMHEGQMDKFKIVVLGLLSVYAIRFICDGASLIFGNKVLNTFTYHLRKDVFKKYAKAPYSFIEKKDTGELKMRMLDDVNSLGNFIREQVVEYMAAILMIVFSLYMVFTISRTMTLYCLAIIPLVFLMNYLIGIGTRKTNEKIRKVSSDYFTSTHNSLQFWREIKAQNSEQTFIDRFKGYRKTLAKLGIRSITFWGCQEVFNDFKANYLTKVFVYIIGAFFVMNQEISVGVLLMFSEYFAMLFSALDNMNAKRVSLRTNAPYYNRIFETFTFPDTEAAQAVPFEFSERITFEDVSFSYTEENPVLKHINLQIDKGEYLAVVGKTGCGKTTLIKLLLGLYETGEGTIRVDGAPLNSIDKPGMYEKIGVVMQDNFLFNTSIRENVVMANEQAADEDILEACHKANIYDFIKSLPEGLDTIIGERGIKLSGGQKQRLSIAAALLRNPQILIFDEATSSLDKPSEDVINQAIHELSKEITVIVITHKPATALRAGKVVVMDEGRITAAGTHAELMTKSDYYNRLTEAAN